MQAKISAAGSLFLYIMFRITSFCGYPCHHDHTFILTNICTSTGIIINMWGLWPIEPVDGLIDSVAKVVSI